MLLKKLAKNRKAQNTAEYAILISLVVAGVVAMQQFTQRALQARGHDAVVYMRDSTIQIGNTLQSEPYYKKSDFQTTSDGGSTENINGETDSRGGFSNESRTGTETILYSKDTPDLGDALKVSINDQRSTQWEK